MILEVGQFKLGRLLSGDLQARLLNYPMATLPERKITQNTSPIGIDRAILFDDKGYNNRKIDLIIGFEGKKSEANVAKFLSGLDTGKYVDFQMYSDDGYTYQVTRDGEATLARPSFSASYRELTLSLNVAPYKYVYPVQTVSVPSAGSITVTNLTNFNAKPIITITAKGDTTLTVNGKALNISNVQSEITLNSELQDAYIQEGSTVTNANNQVSVGAYPILKTGDNTISLTNGTATIETRWRTI